MARQINSKSFSCIIPFYNEGENLLAVIEVVAKVDFITQIICVNDGSTDDTSALIKKHFPNVLVLELPTNGGKAQAVQAGLHLATNDRILLLDGDLRHLRSEELAHVLGKFSHDPSVDMIILQVKGKNTLSDAFLRKDIFQGGNRVMKKTDLEAVFHTSPSGYQLEVAINQHMLRKRKKVRWVKCSAFNPHKTQKFSSWKGIVKDVQMDKEIITFLGVGGYLKQMFFFCRRKV